MSELITAIPTGVTAFTATNLDDIVILLLFFLQVNAVFRRRHIVIGQYLGFAVLVIASLPAFFGSLILPQPWIGLLGVLPIAIGVSQWLSGNDDESNQTEETTPQFENSSWASFLSPQTYSVAAVTVANGSDNLSIYVPLFANTSLAGLGVILGVFFTLVGVWCYAAYQLTRMGAIAQTLTRYGNQFIPFILMGLGILILVKSHTLESPMLSAIGLVAGGFYLLTSIRNDDRKQVKEN